MNARETLGTRTRACASPPVEGSRPSAAAPLASPRRGGRFPPSDVIPHPSLGSFRNGRNGSRPAGVAGRASPIGGSPDVGRTGSSEHVASRSGNLITDVTTVNPMPPRLPREKLIPSVRRLLRPLVRRLLHWEITYPVLDDILRSLFVEVAATDFALPHKHPTDSRISLVTGIHRKEVARLRELPALERASLRLEETIVTRVIGRWMAGPPYADRQHRAKPLPYEVTGSRQSSFSRLVGEAGFDGPVRSVLDEMLRSGAVVMSDDGRVELVREANISVRGVEGKLELLGSDPGEIFDTIVHNLESPGEPWFHRKVVYDNIGADSLPDLRRDTGVAGESLIREANALLAARDRDRNPEAPGGRRSRVVVATYYFEEPLEPAAPGEAAATTAPGRLPGRITRARDALRGAK